MVKIDRALEKRNSFVNKDMGEMREPEDEKVEDFKIFMMVGNNIRFKTKKP